MSFRSESWLLYAYEDQKNKYTWIDRRIYYMSDSDYIDKEKILYEYWN